MTIRDSVWTTVAVLLAIGAIALFTGALYNGAARSKEIKELKEQLQATGPTYQEVAGYSIREGMDYWVLSPVVQYKGARVPWCVHVGLDRYEMNLFFETEEQAWLVHDALRKGKDQ